MDNNDIKDLIFDLLEIRGKLLDAKRTSQRHIQGWDWGDNLSGKVDYLEGLLSEVSDELDEVLTKVDILSEGLEGRLYNNVMDELSQTIRKKYA
jgi:hypothetical protein